MFGSSIIYPYGPLAYVKAGTISMERCVIESAGRRRPGIALLLKGTSVHERDHKPLPLCTVHFPMCLNEIAAVLKTIDFLSTRDADSLTSEALNQLSEGMNGEIEVLLKDMGPNGRGRIQRFARFLMEIHGEDCVDQGVKDCANYSTILS